MANWTTEVYIYIVSLVIFLAGLLYAVQSRKKLKYKFHRYLILCWVCMVFWVMFETLAYVFLSPLLLKIGLYFVILGGFCITFLVNIMSRPKTTFTHFIVLVIVGTLSVYSSFSSGSIIQIQYSNENWTLAMAGPFRTFQSLYNMLYGLLWLYYNVKIYLIAPSSLKKIGFVNLIGVLIISVLLPIGIGLGWTLVMTGFIPVLTVIGINISFLALLKEPKLAFILPFKLNHLLLINSKSGIPLYSFNWDKTLNDDQHAFRSGIFKSLNIIFTEEFNQGEIVEVKSQDGVFYISNQPSTNVLGILQLNESVPFIQNVLKEFTTQFSEIYEDIIDNPVEVSQFQSADLLVHNLFSFIP